MKVNHLIHAQQFPLLKKIISQGATRNKHRSKIYWKVTCHWRVTVLLKANEIIVIHEQTRKWHMNVFFLIRKHYLLVILTCLKKTRNNAERRETNKVVLRPQVLTTVLNSLWKLTSETTRARELRREKAHFPLPHALFSLELLFSTSLLSEGLTRATRQIARKTAVKRTSHTSENLANYVRNSYNMLEIRLSQHLKQL